MANYKTGPEQKQEKMRRLMQSFKQHIDLKNAERFSINEQGSEAICTEKINGHQGKQVLAE